MLKLKAATFDRHGTKAAAFLEFDDGRTVRLDDIKRSLLSQGAVYLGIEGMEPITVKIGTQSIQYFGCTRDPEVIAAARKFIDHVDRRIHLTAGESLLPPEPITDADFAVAIHEAAHAIVEYRSSGFVGGTRTIVSDCETGNAGSVSDSFNEDHCRSRILSCYAGSLAEQKLGSYIAGDACQDETNADELLRSWEWMPLREQLREDARLLVEKHWREISAVAKELLERTVLDDCEIMTIADIVAGECQPEDLTSYRELTAV